MVRDSKINEILNEAYIIGGSPCSGKSTIAEMLAAQQNLAFYKVDHHSIDHNQRFRPDRHPMMWQISKMSWSEIWSRPVSEQVADELVYYSELLEMILDDLPAYSTSSSIIIEGAALLPELINGLSVDPRKVVYLVPTLDFQIHHYRKRPWIHKILKDCEKPKQAFENWMMRDHHFGKEVIRQARLYRYPTLIVDGSEGIQEIFIKVSSVLGFNTHSIGSHQTPGDRSSDTG
jgi:adenylate kinase family enzyme